MKSLHSLFLFRSCVTMRSVQSYVVYQFVYVCQRKIMRRCDNSSEYYQWSMYAMHILSKSKYILFLLLGDRI